MASDQNLRIAARRTGRDIEKCGGSQGNSSQPQQRQPDQCRSDDPRPDAKKQSGGWDQPGSRDLCDEMPF
ncbi:MAG: hypothetical protein ABF968_04960 [Acetobacter sp.]|uniref:hypothetical protein n=1 Tax=Acetobacter sp. TaxID=440 RepID=UPI0039ED7606